MRHRGWVSHGCVLAAALTAASSARAAAPMVRGACAPPPPGPPIALPSKANALDLLGSLTQLQTRLGRPVLATNLATTVAINTTASGPVRAQALRDAQVTGPNAFALADGLGTQLAQIYRDKATFESADDGRHVTSASIGPAVEALIGAAGRAVGGDSGEAKCAFANGVEPHQNATYTPPAGGVTDVLGQAYHHPAGAPGAGIYGNSRPYQTAPIDAATGPRIATFAGVDFFGVPMNSRVVLQGATPADIAAGRYALPLDDSPSYPSGHTTFAFGEGLLLAMMVPERYGALAYRASEYGNSRIVLGAHYTVDVIGGRTLATYDLAQMLAGKTGYGEAAGGTFRAKLADAARELRADLQQHGCPNIAACARDPIVRADQAVVMVAGHPQGASPRAVYAYRLNYGLAAMGPTDRPPDPMPVAAGFLLESRFPYLTPEQRSDVLRSTEGPSGHFLDVSPVDGAPLSNLPNGPASQAGAYSRIDLFAAAGGYGAFSDRVVVEQDAGQVTDPNLQPFVDTARADTWSNDIGGPGGLTKRGPGTLTLSGANIYAGPTLVEGGTLAVTGSLASATTVEAGTLAGTGTLAGELFVLKGAVLAPGATDAAAAGGLQVGGLVALAAGSTLQVRGVSDKALVQGALVDGASRVILDAPTLAVTAKLEPGRHLTLLSARDGILGRFAHVTLADPSLEAKVDYTEHEVTLTVVPKGPAPN